jgi:hypothetical protein
MVPSPRLLGASLALLAVALPAPALGDSLRCDGGIVSVGDSKLDLLGKCGQPTLREEQAEERSRVRLDPAGRAVAGRTIALAVERWTYNFGPRQFVQHVTLESGKVTAVERGSYGYELEGRRDAPAIPRARCDQLSFHLGDSTFDLLARCGEPALRDVKVVTHTSGATSAGGATFDAAVTTELLEIWTYDLGPQALVRRLWFERGKLVRVETGGYGYSRAEAR